MISPALIKLIIESLTILKSFFKDSVFCKVGVITIAIWMTYITYYILFFLPNTIPSDYLNSAKDDKVTLRILKTLKDCGNLSFIYWVVIKDGESFDNHKFLRIKQAWGCDKNRIEGCIASIKFDNEDNLIPHPINKDSIDFVQGGIELPNGEVFKELVPYWFNLRHNKTGKLTEEADFLRRKAPSFWKIIKKRKLDVYQLGVIVIKDNEKKGNPVIHIFTLSFVNNSERKCTLRDSGKSESQYLYEIGLTAKQNLLHN